MQPPLSQLKQKHLALHLVKRMDSYPYLPPPSDSAISGDLARRPLRVPSPRVSIDLITPSWANLGKFILSIVATEQHGHADVGWPQGPGEGILIRLPGGE